MQQCAVQWLPLVAESRHEGEDITKALDAAIQKWAAEGWRFVRIERVDGVAAPRGCMAGMFSSPHTRSVQVVILERA